MTINAVSSDITLNPTEGTAPQFDQQAMASLRAEISDLLGQIKQGLNDFFESQGLEMPSRLTMHYQQSYLSVEGGSLEREVEEAINHEGQLMSQFNQICDYARMAYGMSKTSSCHGQEKQDFNQIFYQSMSMSVTASHEEDYHYQFEWELTTLRMSNDHGWALEI